MSTRPNRPPAAVIAILVAVACSDAPPELAAPLDTGLAATVVNGPPAEFCGLPTTATLYADENRPVGTVRVVNDADHLYVTYRTDPGWPIGKTALFVGASIEDVPMTGGGNPRLGRFPYGARHRSSPMEVTLRVARSEAGPEYAAVAAFAEVGAQAEGAWAGETPISPGGSWATWFEHAIQSCGTLVDSETGGTVTFGEIVALTIPGGALEDDEVITIVPSSSSNAQVLPGTVFDFGPDGLTFDQPAALTIHYDPAVLPAGVPETAIRPTFVINGVFEFLPLTSQNTSDKTITFPVEHFSLYGLAWHAGDLAIAVNAAPDPVRISENVTIDLLVSNVGTLGEPVAEAEVLITLSGHPLIRSFVSPACIADGQPGPDGEIFIYCTVGPLDSGDVVPLQIVGSPFNGVPPEPILVHAEVLPIGADGYEDTNVSNNADAASIAVVPDVSADLILSAFGPGAPRQAGLEKTVSATVRSDATSLDPVDASIRFLFSDAGPTLLEVVADQLPPGCTFAQGLSQTSVTCDVGTLAPGAEAMRQIVVRPLAARLYPVSATGLPTAGDPNAANNTQSGSFTATESSLDLAAAIVVDQTEVDAGDNLLFSAQVQHLGGDLLPNGTLRLEFEGDATLVSGDAGCTQVDVFPFTAAFNCPLSLLEAGQNSPVAQITLQANTPGTQIAGHARLLLPSYVNDTNSANDTDRVDITVRPDQVIDLRMKAFGPGAPIQAGLEKTISATLENQAVSTDAVDATIRFHFSDAGATLLEVINDQLPANCVVTQVSSQTTVNCDVGTLAPGAEAMRQIVVRPLAARLYPVSATGLPEAGDASPANNTQSGSFTATETNLDLAAAIVVDQTEVDAGDNLLFSAQVQHLGGDLLPNGTLRLEFDGDATLVSGDAGCTEISVSPFVAAFNCPLPQLEAGQNSPVAQITLQANTPGTAIAGHARLLLPSYVNDTNSANDADRVDVTVRPDQVIDLRMKAFGPGAPIQAGLEKTISATLENQAVSTDAVDAIIRFHFSDAGATLLEVINDQLPAGCAVTQVSSQTTVNCDVGSLAPGAEAMRQIVVRPLAARLYPVSATGLPEAGDASPANNTQSGSFTATETNLDLAARLVASQSQIEIGETVDFSARVEHLGGDLLPNGTLRIEIEGDATLVSGDAGCTPISVFPFTAAFNCTLPGLTAGQNSTVFLTRMQAAGNGDITAQARLLLPSYVNDTNGSNDTEFATVAVGAPQPAGTLVFSSTRNAGGGITNGQLFTKDLATGSITRINDFQNFADSEWSPDGSRIATIFGTSLFIMDADGGNALQYHMLNEFGVVVPGSPSWSPDGSKIVLHAHLDVGEQDFELWVFDVATESLTQLTDNAVDDEFPDWSPEGTSIAYTVDRASLWTIEPNGTFPIERLGGTSVLHPDWAPDGVHVAFTQLQAAGSSIATMNIGDPSSLMTLEDDGRANLEPAWSPDGLFLAFAKDKVDDDEAFDIWYILADGTGSAQLLEGVTDFSTSDVDWK